MFSVTVVWATTAVASILAPRLVTGTDPTRIPLVAMLVPLAALAALAAMAVTGFLAVRPATDHRNAMSEYTGFSSFRAGGGHE